MRLSLFFLGPFQVTLDEGPAIFATDRARALLAYLAVEADRPHRRDALAGLLWPDQPESLARRSLSQALVRLRRAIDDYHASPPFLLITGKTIQFDAATADLDVARFETLLAACAAHPHPDISGCPSCIQRLGEAASLYRGEFLQGLFLAGGQLFEEWALFKRELLQRQALDALHTLTVYYERQGAYHEAQRYAEHQLGLESWREAAHRQLMRALALSGQRSAALAQYQTCRRVLADELSIEPGPETTALYERIRRGELGPADHRVPVPALSPRPVAPPHNLPPQTTPFVGRETELAELTRLLADPEVRLVTILGSGGMGKTRLAVEAATARLGAFAHGARFIPLASVDPAELAGSISPLTTVLADVLNIAFHVNDTPRNQLLAYLQGKEMLLILDSPEHLIESAQFVSDLLQHLPQLKVLVTSRQRLDLREEWLFPLQGLQVPAEIVSTSDLGEYEAIHLFAEHARQVQPHFDLAAEVAWVIRICRLVDGMPLGIELAAAWVRLMSPQAVVQEIQQSIDFLATTLRNVPERHRSLRAIFDQSWRLLSEEEREVLKKLSVFRGEFQREVAEAVAGASLWLLSSLADKSLLRVIPDGRYRMHDLLCQYAAEKLRQNTGEYEQTRDLHCLVYLDFLRQQEVHLKGPGLKAAIQAITTDIDNLRIAWRWAVERGRLAEIEQTLLSLWHFYEAKGWYLEADDALGQAAARLRGHCEAPATAEQGAPRKCCLILGLVLAHQAWFETRLGRFERAKALFQESFSILRPAGKNARREIALSLMFLGEARCIWGEPAAAIGPLQESLTIFNQIGEPWESGTAMSLLGEANLLVGRYVEAQPLLEESVRFLTEMGNQVHTPYTMSALGHIAQVQGRLVQAETIYRKCLETRKEIADRTGMAFSLCDLGEVARLGGAYTQAEGYYQQSLSISKGLGFRAIGAEALRGLGNLAERRRDYGVARQFFQESLSIYSMSGLYAHSPSALTGLGWAALGLAEYEEARQYFYQALRLETKTQRQPIILDALAGLAHYLAEKGEPEHALELLALISHHPASTQETRDRAATLDAGLAAQMVTEVVAAAQARGQKKTLEGVVQEILG